MIVAWLQPGAQVERRCGKPPKRLLADVGAMTAPDIVGFAQTHPQMQVFSPPPARKETSKPESKARYERNRAAEPQCLKDWRGRLERVCVVTARTRSLSWRASPSAKVASVQM